MEFQSVLGSQRGFGGGLEELEEAKARVVWLWLPGVGGGVRGEVGRQRVGSGTRKAHYACGWLGAASRGA